VLHLTKMTLSELHIKLNNNGINEDHYFLHGLFGSTNDSEKIALTIRKGKYTVEYETYFKERGEKHSIRIFTSEEEACEYIYKELIDEQTYNSIQNIEGLSGMTVNERLYVSGLMEEFDIVKTEKKSRAKEILRWLRVDEPSIREILK
jgi:hypothetical protein